MGLPITVADLYQRLANQTISKLTRDDRLIISGWVRTNRNNGSVGFIELNDGTHFKNMQLVYSKQLLTTFEAVSKYGTGSAIEVTGSLKLTPEMKQPFELHVDECQLVGSCDEDYPLQKKRHSFEYLRDIAHLRVRTNTFTALNRVRSVLAMAIHEFFQRQGYIYVHTPIITGNDAEGAGQVFKVMVDEKKPDAFFGKPGSLTVSGQLHVEPFALAFRNVYTFGPTFRAEYSNTPRHSCEFWMIEPEMAFADLNDDMDVIEGCIKFCIEYVLERCPAEMEFFNSMIDTTLQQRLEALVAAPFKKLTYTEGINLLKQAVASGHKFDNANIEWGMDLQSEHERYLTEHIVKGPLFLINYPKEIKAFYMRLNDDGKTVAACDLLVPQVGELVGGSQREERFDLLAKRMEELGNRDGLEWYLDLRKYGGVPHAGFGIGFDRLLMYMTGISNIRDTQPYPRNPGSLKY
jgi:asparaginyl-tRNA synthetase